MYRENLIESASSYPVGDPCRDRAPVRTFQTMDEESQPDPPPPPPPDDPPSQN